MGTISSGVGIISGINYGDLVDQLMAIEKRPQVMLQDRVKVLEAQRTAFMSLAALILAAKGAAGRFDEPSLFSKAKAVSSDGSVIGATADSGAVPGTYSFLVSRLASSHQLASNGFKTADATHVGAGTIRIESAAARVAPHTLLSTLRGGAGVRQGTIRLTDRSGASTDIDLSAALTIDDVVEAINGQSEVDVTASTSGGHLVLTDHTGQTNGDLRVVDVGAGRMAADLGIAGRVSADTLTGSDVVYVTEDTPLQILNDVNGVRRGAGLNDFRIHLRDGSTVDVDVSGRLRNDTRLAALNRGQGIRLKDDAGAPLGTIQITNRRGSTGTVDLGAADTIEDVVRAVNDAVDGAGNDLNVTAVAVEGHLVISDSTTGSGKLKIEDVGGGHAAEDLGIAQEVGAGKVTGYDIYQVDTLADVIRAINLDSENVGGGGGARVVASISADDQGITLSDTTTGVKLTSVEALNGSRAATDLGLADSTGDGTIQSAPLMAGLQTVLLRSLNGGRGMRFGTIQLTARDGTTTSIDMSDTHSLGEFIERINARKGDSKVSASVNPAGTGIRLQDLSGGTGDLIINGTLTSGGMTLPFSFRASAAYFDSGDLHHQYINENTLLQDLNGGQGVAAGKFKITNSKGLSVTLDLSGGKEKTLGGVIDRINALHMGVEASINGNGDGLLLTDTAGGQGLLKVAEDGGTMAADLGILGEAKSGETTIDGSFERVIEVTGSDTLNDLVTKINGAKANVQASVLNDGSLTTPYRLVVTSRLNGSRGELIVDTGATNLSLSTLSEARDAVVFLGQPGSGRNLLLSSSSNTLDGAVPKVKIDLLAASRTPVEVAVSRDVDSIVGDIRTFVTAFNAVIDKMSDLTSFDPETYKKGTLFGDATLEQVRSRLYAMMRQTVSGAGIYQRFSDVGLTLGSGAKLQFDEDRFRAAMASNPQDVKTLFTKAKEGLGAVVDQQLSNLATSNTGLIAQHDDSLQSQEDMLNKRIADMQVLLDSKQQRMLQQFYAMEQALAQLQSQQSALTSLSALVTQMYSTSSRSSSNSNSG